MAKVTYVSGPRVERVIGPDRRYTGETKIILAIAYGKHETQHLIELNEADLLRIASGSIEMLDHLRRDRENRSL
jgi:hypothetical protein